MTIGLTRIRAWVLILSAALVSPVMLLSLACGGGDNTLTVYSGRSQNLVNPILERFIEDSGINIQVKYAGSSAIAATILEEGENTRQT